VRGCGKQPCVCVRASVYVENGYIYIYILNYIIKCIYVLEVYIKSHLFVLF